MAASGNQDKHDELRQRLHLNFSDEELLIRALTHRSYSAESESEESNERLEFLGDAVLDVIIAEELFRAHPDWPEGMLTKVKASIVGERSLERVARNWELGRYMRISHGEESSGGRERRALLADAVEAIIGALYLDQGLDASRILVLREMALQLEAADRQEHDRDYKTQLQEVFQARFQAAPSYAVTAESGPPHARIFEVAVSFGGEILGRGSGHSKKEAEQLAASEALQSAIVSEHE